MELAVDFAAVGCTLVDCTASAVRGTVVELVPGCNRGDREVAAWPICKKWFVVVGTVAVLARAAGKLEKDEEIRSSECYVAFPVDVDIRFQKKKHIAHANVYFVLSNNCLHRVYCPISASQCLYKRQGCCSNWLHVPISVNNVVAFNGTTI